MKTVIPLLILIAVWPTGGDAEQRFELRSRFTPMPETTGGRFAMKSRLERSPDAATGAGRFSLKAALKGPASACADILFRDGFE